MISLKQKQKIWMEYAMEKYLKEKKGIHTDTMTELMDDNDEREIRWSENDEAHYQTTIQ